MSKCAAKTRGKIFFSGTLTPLARVFSLRRTRGEIDLLIPRRRTAGPRERERERKKDRQRERGRERVLTKVRGMFFFFRL